MTARARGLAMFYTVEEIRTMWAEVLAASYKRTAVNIQINASSKPDGRASSGITLTSSAEQEAFMSDCQLAIDYLNGQADRGPVQTDHSQTMIRA